MINKEKSDDGADILSSGLMFNPLIVESSKYDRDLKLLESLNCSIISKKDKTTLYVLCLSYGIEVDIKRENFHFFRGKLIEHIKELLSELSGVVVDRMRSLDLGKKSIIPKRSSGPLDVRERWGITEKITVKKKVV